MVETGVGEIGRVVPVAAHRRLAADPHEITQTADISRKRGQKTLFMIADEQPCILELVAQVNRPLDDFGRLRAAIHQIAEKDQGDARRSARSVVGTGSEEHTSELQSLMRTSYAVFCLK